MHKNQKEYNAFIKQLKDETMMTKTEVRNKLSVMTCGLRVSTVNEIMRKIKNNKKFEVTETGYQGENYHQFYFKAKLESTGEAFEVVFSTLYESFYYIEPWGLLPKRLKAHIWGLMKSVMPN